MVLGRHNLNDSDGEWFSIRGELTNPGWNNNTFENDFMLIILEGTPTADNAITVELNFDPSVPSLGQDMTLMGWGDTDPRHDNPDTSDANEFYAKRDFAEH